MSTNDELVPWGMSTNDELVPHSPVEILKNIQT